MEENRFVITISNQFASMGRVIARRLAELLEVPCYNEYIAEETARRLGLSGEQVGVAEETARRVMPSGFVPSMFQRLGNRANDVQNDIFAAQQDIIRELAARENCVIVGRCGDFALQDAPNALHVYIYAPFEDRVRSCMRELEADESTARAWVAEADERRDAYHLNFTGFLPHDKAHKDILINSSALGVEATARLLAQMARSRFGEK